MIGTHRAIDDRLLPSATEPHETRVNTVLRPVVFGANDGLVSNLALVMGVAAAAPDPGYILLAGIAGLLAGAFSMGVGEYISVQSQRELLDYQVAFQRKQLREVPDQERAILARIYSVYGDEHETIRAPCAGTFIRMTTFASVGAGERVATLGV